MVCGRSVVSAWNVDRSAFVSRRGSFPLGIHIHRDLRACGRFHTSLATVVVARVDWSLANAEVVQ
jgi:hypothetical protein